MPKAIDVTSRRFGRLVAMQLTDKAKDGARRWLCQCDCGRRTKVRVGDLLAGKSKSCHHHADHLRGNLTKWTPSQIALLGTETDRKIAAKLGKTHPAVEAKRRELGLPAYSRRKIQRPCVDCGAPIAGHALLRRCKRCRRRRDNEQRRQTDQRKQIRKLKTIIREHT